MFGIRRGKSHGELARSELGEGLGHLRQAATHAANGVGATVGPRMQTARGYVQPRAAKLRDGASTGWAATMTTLAPLVVAATDGARQAGSLARKAKSKDMRKMRKKKAAAKRRPMMTGLLAAGAVAGMAAMAMRRRRQQQQQWDEYDPGHALSGVGGEVDTLTVSESAKPATGTDKMKESAAKVGDKMAARTASITESVKPTAKPTAPGDGVIGTPAGTGSGSSGNSRH